MRLHIEIILYDLPCSFHLCNRIFSISWTFHSDRDISFCHGSFHVYLQCMMKVMGIFHWDIMH